METIFEKLWMAFVSRQGGTVHIRKLMEPLFDERTASQEVPAFYQQADDTPDMAQTVYDGVVNANLELPERPADDPAPVEPDNPPPPETIDPPPPPADPEPTDPITP